MLAVYERSYKAGRKTARTWLSMYGFTMLADRESMLTGAPAPTRVVPSAPSVLRPPARRRGGIGVSIRQKQVQATGMEVVSPDLLVELLLISVMPTLGRAPESPATGASNGFCRSLWAGALSAPRPWAIIPANEMSKFSRS